ncbi:MAG: DUF2029 domain-containing protein [Chloroflexi bacterium]|nr:MAG: DUF2029 domain-containing protein [Chloroflexota bacterium]
MRALIRLAGVGIVGIALHYIAETQGALLVQPKPAGAFLTVVGLAVALLLLSLVVVGRGEGDGRRMLSDVPRRFVRGLWLAVTAYAFVGVGTFATMLGQSEPDGTPYHNDAIAIQQCAAQLVLQGQDPYRSLDLFSCYQRLGIGPDRTTPLKRGLFADVPVYPTDAQLDAAWDARVADPASNVEFEWRPSYPALAFLLIVPWTLFGFDPNHLSVLLLVLGMTLILLRGQPRARGLLLTAMLSSIVVIAWTIGGSSDLLYAIPLLAAWLWRERRWSALLLGIALATKQLAWFAAPYYLMQVIVSRGKREAVIRFGIASAVFVVTNAPFLLADPAAWIAGVTTPVHEPMFARGAGIVFLSTVGGLPLPSAGVYTVAEGIAMIICLVIGWRARRTSPELGLMLAFVPLFFAWRSLFSYFFLLPLFAAGSIARMRLDVPEVDRIEDAGGVAIVHGPHRPAAAA